MALESELASGFDALWRRIGARGDAAPVFARLTALYSQPHRAYHNLRHIADCLKEFEAARALCERADEVELALWFHDAIYDPRAKENEEQSARLAREVIQGAALPAEFGDHVEALILATKHNAPPRENDARLIVDIDLAILGQDEARFDEYETAIRKEYDWVPEAQFKTGRSAILRSFLVRPRIYSTDFFRDMYEARARRNLDRSLRRLA